MGSKFSFNPFTRKLDKVLNLDNPLQFKGTIAVAGDFPTAAEVQSGWYYIVTADVTDNDATKTNTGQSFESGDEIVWNGTDWTALGNDSIYLRQDGTTDLTGDWTISSNDITLTSGALTVGGVCDLGDTTVDSLVSTGNVTLSTNNIIMTGDIATDGDRVDDIYCTTLYPTKLGEALNANSKKITSLATPTVGTDAATKGYVDSLASGLSWIDAVIKFAAVGDAVEANGNRYICNATGGGWTENNVYEWDGSAWTETVALDAMACKATSEGKFYTYNDSDSEWKDMGATFDHNSLLGLQGGQAVQYYHATEAEKDNWFIKNVDDTDDIIEGSTNLFYTDAKVNALVQNASSDYTIQGDWTFNNLVACANTPTDDNHLARKKYVDDLLSGFTWQEPVADKDLSAPPGSPTLGDRYIIAGSAANWYNASWGYRQKVTIDNTKVAGDETDFPVYIEITDQSNALFDNCQSTGNDILFTTTDGQTKIPHEIEYIKTATTKKLVAWVKSDILGATDTEIYMYYGNPTSGNQQEITSTWNSGYSMVQHLGEASGTFYDSTTYDNDGTDSGGVTYRANGKTGYGVTFDGSNDNIVLPSSNSLTGDSLQTVTIETWIKFTDTGKDYTFSVKRSAAASTLISMSTNHVSKKAGFLTRNAADTTHSYMDSTSDMNDGNWHYIVAVVNGATRTLYVDGSPDKNDSNGMQSVTDNSNPAALGGFSTSSYQYNGSLDEVKFSRVARSTNWISSSYANQNSPSTFFSLGAEETPTASGAWAGHVDDITEWDAIQWTFQTPENGWAVIVTDEAKQYTWNGSEWVGGTATTAHNDTTGKQGGTTDEYYHLEQGEHTELTQWLDDVVLSTNGDTNIGSGDFTTTGDIAVDDITASGIVQTEMVLANGAGSHPSGIGAYVELYVLSGSTCRILPYDGSSYYDLAIGDWNAGDPNIMLKTGGAVGINEGAPAAKLHVGGDFIARVTSGNQIEAQYDASNKLGIAVDSAGDVIITASGGDISFSDENLTTTGVVTAGTFKAVNSITEFSTDATLGDNSDSAIPTEKAVKTYVDTQLTAEDLDFAGDTGTGAVDLDSQTLTVAGTANEIETSASNQTVTVGIVTNPTLAGANITGVASFLVEDESTDVSCFPLFVTAASGTLSAKTGTNLTFNSSTGLLTTNIYDTADSDGVYKINSSTIAQAQTTLYNYYFGRAGNLTGSGNHNTAGGYTSLLSLTDGANNTGFGYYALRSNTGGNSNTAYGSSALTANIGGSSNNAMGKSALLLNTSGNFNNAMGASALERNEDGSYNNAQGYYALKSNTSGNYNTGLGSYVLQDNSTGNNNTGMGSRALLNVEGSGNVGIGYCAGFYETGSDSFYINNQCRTDLADDRASSLMYGTFAAAAADQQITFNVGTATCRGDLILSNDADYIEWNNTNADCEAVRASIIDAGALLFQGQTAGEDVLMALAPADSDGTDSVNFVILGDGQAADFTNRETLIMGWNGGTAYKVATEENGTGTARPLNLYAGTDNEGGHILLEAQGTIDFDLIQDIAVNQALFHFVTDATNGLTSSDGQQNYLQLDPKITQTGTAGYTVLGMNVTEVSTGSATNYLMDLEIGNVSKFSIESNGDVNILADSYINFGDIATNIAQLDDGHLDLTADTSIDLNIGGVNDAVYVISETIGALGTIPMWEFYSPTFDPGGGTVSFAGGMKDLLLIYENNIDPIIIFASANLAAGMASIEFDSGNSTLDFKDASTYAFDGDILYKQEDSDIEVKHQATYSSPSDGDIIASYRFFANDESSSQQEFVRLNAVAFDTGAADRLGVLQLYAQEDGNLSTDPLLIAFNGFGRIEDTTKTGSISIINLFSEWNVAATGGDNIDANVNGIIVEPEFVVSVVDGTLSTTPIAYSIEPTFNLTESGTGTVSGGWTGLKLNVTDTASGSGTKTLADFQLASASKFNVQSDKTEIKPTATEYMTVDHTTIGAMGDVPTIEFTSTNFLAGTYWGGIKDGLAILESNQLGQLLFVNSDASSTCSISHDDTNDRLHTDKNFVIGDGSDKTWSLIFDDNNADGQLDWEGGTDYFVFQDDVLMNSAEKTYYRDIAIGIYSQADTFLDLFADGAVRIGDSSAGAPTNFSKFESDGTLEFNGAATVWKDINLGAAQLSRPSSSQPDLVNFVDEAGADTGIQTYAFAVGEKIHGSFEMQHDYKEGSDFTFHVHWEGITAPTGTDNVQWRLTYTFSADDATLDAVTTIDSADTIFDTQYEFKRTDLVVISGTNREIGQQMLFTLERVASTGDAYAGDALIATVGIHYEIDTVGSRQIIIK